MVSLNEVSFSSLPLVDSLGDRYVKLADDTSKALSTAGESALFSSTSYLLVRQSTLNIILHNIENPSRKCNTFQNGSLAQGSSVKPGSGASYVRQC
jgi:hypothetical protein